MPTTILLAHKDLKTYQHLCNEPLRQDRTSKKKSKGARIFQILLGRLHRSCLKAFNMIDKNLWLFGQEKNLSALMTEANGREANNVSQRPCAQLYRWKLSRNLHFDIKKLILNFPLHEGKTYSPWLFLVKVHVFWEPTHYYGSYLEYKKRSINFRALAVVKEQHFV